MAKLWMYLPITLVVLCVMLHNALGNTLLNSIQPQSEETRRNTNAMMTSDDVNHITYLEKFGYLPAKTEIGETHTREEQRKAIREFQRMAGIEETGVLDDTTVHWMLQPRCGMPDRIPPDMDMEIEGYNVPGYKWSKDYITWRVNRYSNDLSVDSQRRAMYNAFRHWSDVVPLMFSETTQAADIEILFGAYEHGDGYPFDGEGRTLAHAFYPEDGRTHFDESEYWTEYTHDGTNLEIVAAHEFGHALGLDHSDVEGALMRPFYQGYDPEFKLHSDDIMGIQSLYGTSNPPTEMPTEGPRPTDSPTESPVGPTEPAPERPDSCTTRFHAMFQGSDGSIYVFWHIWVWKLHYWGMYPNYPVLASELFEDPPINIRGAAYSFRTSYTYLFKGLYVHKYYGSRKISKQLIDTPGYEPPQSAVMASDGKIYLLKGRFYWIFNEYEMTLETGVKRRIEDMWPGLPDNIEAAVRLNDGYMYFVKGRRYRKFDEDRNALVAGYPKPKAGPWMGPTCTSDGGYVRK